MAAHGVITFEGRSYRLVPSPGEVIAPKTGTSLHHRSTCPHLSENDEPAWSIHQDPDRDLWRQLIDSAPSADTEGRARFAEDNGLLNGAGKPVRSVCRDCVLIPEPVSASVRLSFEEAVKTFDRSGTAAALAAAKAQIERIQREFPLADWPNLPLRRYALGQPDQPETFCRLIEFNTPELGSISGGSAAKHLIYFQKSGTWHHDASYADEQEAWNDIHAGFLQAFEYAEHGDDIAEIDTIEALRSAPALTSKALFAYFPDRFLPIYSRSHIRHFTNLLSKSALPVLDPFAAHARLLRIVRETPQFDGWDPLEVMQFLYWWEDPRQVTNIVKIATGADAKYWNDCLDNGYICVGWDDVGDLTEYATAKEFRTAFGEKYPGPASHVTNKSKEPWRLTQLRPGDLVVANRGKQEILGVGTVTEPGYVWRPDRSEFRHTVTVDWDTSYRQKLETPQNHWAFVTVSDVPQDLWRTIREGRTDGSTAAPVDAGVAAAPPDEHFAQLKEALHRKGQAILFGPPGTGKTFTALRFALWWLASEHGSKQQRLIDPLAAYATTEFQEALATLSTPYEDAPVGPLTQITFHPSYGYEDFIEGFRPVEHGGNGLQLSRVDGIFAKVCNAAKNDPAHPYLLLIDEINRGDMPKIFGELITLIEKDKRSLETRLPQSGNSFSVPPNVYILGTMNTADRSIRLLDSALRRRFAFLEIMPEAEKLKGSRIGRLDLGDLLTQLNSNILRELGRERQIGHSFFLRSDGAITEESELAAVFYNEILPILQEYLYDDYSALARFVGNDIVDTKTHQLQELTADELITALYALTQGTT